MGWLDRAWESQLCNMFKVFWRSFCSLKKRVEWDSHGGPVAEIVHSNAGDTSPIPSWGTKIPHAMAKKKKFL